MLRIIRRPLVAESKLNATRIGCLLGVVNDCGASCQMTHGKFGQEVGTFLRERWLMTCF